MLIRANTDGTYSANWTPGAVGLYTIHVTIDGIETGMLIYVSLRTAPWRDALMTKTYPLTQIN